MADVFISYSRHDADFVNRLARALVNVNRAVWVDWQNIPRGEDWWGEIQLGIENIDSFVCVISENWLASEICHRELRYARRNNKRIIPIMRQQIGAKEEKRVGDKWQGQSYEKPARDNWEYIRHLNWIFFHDDAKFDTEFAVLLKTIDEDQSHIRSHTRYQNRALEWERGEKNPSFFLNGDDLKFAENWLARTIDEGKTPAPTRQQHIYITESRKHEDNRFAVEAARERRIVQFRRVMMLLGVMGVLALAAFAVSVYGITQSNQAILVGQQTQTAVALDVQRQQQRLESIRLVEAARSTYANGNSNQGLALALAALDLPEPPAIAESVLASISYESGLHQQIAADGDMIYKIIYSPSGDRFITLANDSRVTVWNAERIEPVQTFQIPPENESSSLKIAWNGNRFVAIFDNTLSSWEVETETLLWQTSLDDAIGVGEVAVSPDGFQIAVAQQDGRVSIWDAESGKRLTTYSGHTDAVTTLSYSPDGQYLISGSNDTTLILRNAQTGEELAQLRGHYRRVNSVAFSPGSDLAVSTGDDGLVFLWDVVKQELKLQYQAFSTLGTVATFDPSGNTILVGGCGVIIGNFCRRGEIVLLDLNYFLPKRRYIGHQNMIATLVFTPDGKRALSGSCSGKLILCDSASILVWDIAYGAEEKHRRLTTYFPDSVITRSGNYLFVDRVSGVEMWELEQDTLVQTFETGFIEHFAVSEDEKLLAVVLKEGGIQLWDISQVDLLYSLEDEDTVFTHVLFSADGKYFITGSETSRMVIWETAGGKYIREWRSDDVSNLTPLAVSPNNRFIVTGGKENEIMLWKTDESVPTRSFEGHLGHVMSASFSPDSRFLLSGSVDNTAILWNVQTGEMVKILAQHSQPVSGVDFSPDGQQALTGSLDNNIVIWDLSQLEPIRILQGNVDSIQNARFDSTGDHILSTGMFSWVGRWRNESLAELIAWTCANRLVTPLTQQEQRQYNISNYSPPCATLN